MQSCCTTCLAARQGMGPELGCCWVQQLSNVPQQAWHQAVDQHLCALWAASNRLDTSWKSSLAARAGTQPASSACGAAPAACWGSKAGVRSSQERLGQAHDSRPRGPRCHVGGLGQYVAGGCLEPGRCTVQSWAVCRGGHHGGEVAGHAACQLHKTAALYSALYWSSNFS